MKAILLSVLLLAPCSLLLAASDHPSKWSGCMLSLEPLGGLTDSSFFQRVVSNNGGVGFGAGPSFGAYSFASANEYLSTDAFEIGGKQISISVWYKGNTTNTLDILCERTVNNNNFGVGWLFSRLGSAEFRVTMSTGASVFNTWTSAIKTNPNQWYHVVAVLDKTAAAAVQGRLWVNGQLDGSNTVAGDMSAFDFSGSHSIFIGDRSGGGVGSADGFIANLRIYRRILTEFEINQLYYGRM